MPIVQLGECLNKIGMATHFCQRNWHGQKSQYLLDHWKSKRVPEKTSISTLSTMPKSLTVWITINCGKFWKRWGYQTTWPASWETCMQIRKQQLELDMKQQTGSKQEKEYVKAVYCHPAYLTYMQSTWAPCGPPAPPGWAPVGPAAVLSCSRSPCVSLSKLQVYNH